MDLSRCFIVLSSAKKADPPDCPNPYFKYTIRLVIVPLPDVSAPRPTTSREYRLM